MSPTLNVPNPSRWSAVAPSLVAALAALVVYGCTLKGTFVYDDRAVIISDPRASDAALWGQYWTKPYMQGPDKLYRPLVSLSFAVQRRLTGLNPWPFHAVNWLVHACVAAAVAEFGRRLTGMRVAWIAGLLFAVHPVHVEVVAGLVGRSELLCALATIAGLCAFLAQPMSAARVGFIGLCCAVALLSKEQGMLFPLLVLALLPLRRARGAADHATAGNKAGRWLAVTLCYLPAGYFFLRERVIGFGWDRIFLAWHMNPMIRSQGIDRVLMPMVLIGRYVVLLVAPHRQSLDYGGYAIGWTVRPQDQYLWIGVAAVIGWLALAAWASVRRRWAVLFCLVALALTYGMVGNIVALIGTIFGDRLMYLPSAFFLLLVAMFLAQFPRSVFVPIVIVVTLAGSWATVAYARLWNDPLALFEACVRNQPAAQIPYEGVFAELYFRGRYSEAREVARAAAAAVPDSQRPYELGMEADAALGDKEDAQRLYDRGISACRGLDKTGLQLAGSDILRRVTTRPAR